MLKHDTADEVNVATTRFLAVGMLLSGLFAYIFFVVATRTLGDEGGAALAVVWAYWNMASAFLSFPLQHWIDRTCTADGHGGAVRSALPSLALAIGLLALASGAGAQLLHDQLFGPDAGSYPLAIAAVTVGLGVGGVVRGLLASAGRHRAVVAELVAENVVRAVGAIAVAALGWSTDLFAWVLAGGAAVSLLAIGNARFVGPPADRTATLGFLGDIAGGSLLSQVVLTSSPLSLQLMGAPAGIVTATFSAMAIARVPYLIALGIVTQLTSTLTRWHLGDRRDLLRRTRIGVAVGALLIACIAAPVAAGLGNDVLGQIYDLETQLSSGALAAIGFGTCLAIGNLVLGLVLVARGSGRPVVAAWVLGLLTFVLGTMALGDWQLHTRVLTSFALAELITLLGLVLGDVMTAKQAVSERR